MSEPPMHDHSADDAAGRHRGPASADDADKAQQPQGKHRRPSKD